jgi:sugar/nucleoside kinase (ribokinase family)
MKITFIGHVCIDKNVVRGQTETFYGGGVIHGAITASRLGARAAVITKCAAADRGGFTAFDGTEVEAVFLTSESSTSIRNVYPNDNPDDRQSFLISKADPFTSLDLETLQADVVHLNPLWYGEFPLSLLPLIKPRAGLLAGDAQGLLRHADQDGVMTYLDLPEKNQALAWFDVFKVDANEAYILTGENDVRASARAVHQLGPGIVLLSHRGGVCVYDGREFYESPFTSFTLEGRTGRGDTCTGAFLTAMQRMSLREATALAAEVTSRKMQYRGPYRG